MLKLLVEVTGDEVKGTPYDSSVSNKKVSYKIALWILDKKLKHMNRALKKTVEAWLGSYDQCLHDSSNGTINSNYFLTSIPINQSALSVPLKVPGQLAITAALSLPDACSTDDVTGLAIRVSTVKI